MNNNHFALDLDFINPSNVENEVLNQLYDSYIKESEMSAEERAFLNALILRNKPKKLLELGVSAGGSSIVILNAIKDIAGAKLYSIDLEDYYYKNPNLKTGYLVDNYQYLKSKWELFTGGLACSFVEKIGSDVDFCFIDTVHANPGEILDFLMVLPILKEDAIIVFHDVNLHTMEKIGIIERSITNNLLMSSIMGKEILQGNFKKNGDFIFPNIGGIKINQGTKERLFKIFNLLTLRWHYIPSDNQETEMISFFEKYYDSFYVNYLKDVFLYQKKTMDLRKTMDSNVNYGFKYILKNIIKKVIKEKNILKIKKLLRWG